LIAEHPAPTGSGAPCPVRASRQCTAFAQEPQPHVRDWVRGLRPPERVLISERADDEAHRRALLADHERAAVQDDLVDAALAPVPQAKSGLVGERVGRQPERRAGPVVSGAARRPGAHARAEAPFPGAGRDRREQQDREADREKRSGHGRPPRRNLYSSVGVSQPRLAATSKLARERARRMNRTTRLRIAGAVAGLLLLSCSTSTTNPNDAGWRFLPGHVEALDVPAFRGGRPCRIYLPPGYTTSDRRYPVLYLNDGAEVFDPGGVVQANRICEDLIRGGEIVPIIMVAIPVPSDPDTVRFC